MTKKKQKELDFMNDPRYHYQRSHVSDVVGTIDIDRYLKWCKDNGFKATIYKSWFDMKKEKLYIARKKCDEKLLARRKFKNPRKALDLVFDSDIVGADAAYKNLYSRIKTLNKKDKTKFKKLITHIYKHSDILKDPPLITGLLNIMKWEPYYINRPTEWMPKTHNTRRQFSDLLRHSFCKYDVPKFMDEVWFSEYDGAIAGAIAAELKREWFIFIGQGGNLRKARKLPFEVTKKIAHYFMQAPGNFSVENALIWGVVHSMGGDKRTVEGILSTKRNGQLNRHNFWVTVYRFFVNNPMLDTAQYNPIVDYIDAMKYQPQYEWTEPGIRVERPPIQPNFMMRGRTAFSLLRQVEAWHKKLGKEKKGGKLQWEKSKYNGFECQTGERRNVKIWTINELLSSDELIQEGKTMRHCVASYARSCQSQRVSIWSMKVDTWEGKKNVLTIEVRDGTIMQARGKRNERPTEEAKNIIKKWKKTQGLGISSYI